MGTFTKVLGQIPKSFYGSKGEPDSATAAPNPSAYPIEEVAGADDGRLSKRSLRSPKSGMHKNHLESRSGRIKQQVSDAETAGNSNSAVQETARLNGNGVASDEQSPFETVIDSTNIQPQIQISSVSSSASAESHFPADELHNSSTVATASGIASEPGARSPHGGSAASANHTNGQLVQHSNVPASTSSLMLPPLPPAPPPQIPQQDQSVAQYLDTLPAQSTDANSSLMALHESLHRANINPSKSRRDDGNGNLSREGSGHKKASRTGGQSSSNGQMMSSASISSNGKPASTVTPVSISGSSDRFLVEATARSYRSLFHRPSHKARSISPHRLKSLRWTAPSSHSPLPASGNSVTSNSTLAKTPVAATAASSRGNGSARGSKEARRRHSDEEYRLAPSSPAAAAMARGGSRAAPRKSLFRFRDDGSASPPKGFGFFHTGSAGSRRGQQASSQAVSVGSGSESQPSSPTSLFDPCNQHQQLQLQLQQPQLPAMPNPQDEDLLHPITCGFEDEDSFFRERRYRRYHFPHQAKLQEQLPLYRRLLVHPPDEALLQYDGVTVYGSDLRNLQEPEWLNDNNLAFVYQYLENTLLQGFHRKDSILLLTPAIAYLLLHSPYPVESVISALPPLDKAKFIFLPINDNPDVHASYGGTHWSLMLVSTQDRKALYYDTLYQGVTVAAQQTADRLSKVLGYKLEAIAMSTPRQVNGSDCGILVAEITALLLKRLVQTDEHKQINLGMESVYLLATAGRTFVLSKILELVEKQMAASRRLNKEESSLKKNETRTRI